jgi:hypothetical protein
MMLARQLLGTLGTGPDVRGSSEGVVMTQLQQPATSTRSGAAVGFTIFASAMMVLIGTFQMLAGVIALVNDEFYVVTQEWIFQFDVTTWGWIHLALGAVILAAGIGLFSGQVWARTVGVLLAILSAVVSFAWLPWYPIWGVIIITLDVFVIWALTVHGRDIVD